MPVQPSGSTALVTTSGQKIIKRALRLIGALGVGKTLSAAEEQDSLEALNGMIDQWNTEKLALYTGAEYTLVLTPGTQTYSVGEVSADLTANRPKRIEDGQAFLRISGFDYPLASLDSRPVGGDPQQEH
jgi:hypothetical protein